MVGRECFALSTNFFLQLNKAMPGYVHQRGEPARVRHDYRQRVPAKSRGFVGKGGAAK